MIRKIAGIKFISMKGNETLPVIDRSIAPDIVLNYTCTRGSIEQQSQTFNITSYDHTCYTLLLIIKLSTCAFYLRWIE